MNFKKVVPVVTVLSLCPLLGARAQLNVARHTHSNTLLPDGNFLVAGGLTGTDPATTPTTSAEIYNTTLAAFQSIGIVPGVARSSHTATVLGDGRVLIAGGFDSAGAPLNEARIYNNQTNSWAGSAYPMLSARGGHTAHLINKGPNAGDVLLCGGQTGAALASITNTCEIFMRNATVIPYFKSAAPMAVSRMNHASAALSSGNIFISGGVQWDAVAGALVYLPDNEVYDVVTDVWTPVTALLQGRAYHTITTLNTGVIMITGGYNAANFFDLRTDERWYYDNPAAQAAQNAGSHGYLDAAELFDPNGGRVPIDGESYSVMPYRMRFHAAALTATGRVGLDGGYGNMIPTFFNDSPSGSPGSYLRLTRTGFTTTTINPGSLGLVTPPSNVKFPLNIDLSRPVSGRVVDGDIFFSPPKTFGGPSFAVANFTAYLSYSTAPLDGQPIGRVTGPGINAGQFKNEVTLKNPAGTGQFMPEEKTIEIASGGTSAFAFASVPPSGKNNLLPSAATMTVTFNIPKQFYSDGDPSYLAGQATIKAGVISDNNALYTIDLKGGVGIISPTLITYDALNGVGVVTAVIPFTDIWGSVSNPSTSYALPTSSINIVGDNISGLTLTVAYTSDFVDLNGVAYDFNTSSFVVRQMIFSTNLGFKLSNPAFTWDTDHTAYDSSLPLFNHTYMITPAGDELLVGGRNCETSPALNCLRSAPKFTALAARTVIVTIPETTKGSGGWQVETGLHEKRAYHTSTMLPDGSILTCGGSDGAATSKTCELRDPLTGTWNYTGDMASPRSRHTATLLPNGTVLIAGGTTGASTAAVATAELYYPNVKRFVSVQSMFSPRQNHTATLQSDGNVLVAGGSHTGYLTSAEVFLATAAAWQTTGSLNRGRAQHTATLLKNGTVLVTGGINGVALKTTEIYGNGAWTMATPLKDLNIARYSHSSTLLKDGRILVAGGSDGLGPLVETEFYNGTAWSPSGGIKYKRASHKATLLTTGKILLTGGETPGAAHMGAELYNTDFNFWSDYGQLFSSRTNHTAVLAADGNVYVIGGWNGTGYLNSVESVYFAPFPDIYGLEPKTRNPQVSTAPLVDYLDRDQSMTLTSDATNFHGVTEASGGGAGAASSSFHNPRVYLHAVDVPSGFLMDLTTRVYTLFGSANSSWENTLSSITVKLPATAPEMPYGYYYARTAANGQYSRGRLVQITIPRPTGLATNISTVTIGISSITWSWNQGTIAGTVNGYNLYSSTDNLFISTVAFTDPASFTQTGLIPNDAAAISIAGYNIGGDGPLSPSGTYYTYAAAPSSPVITAASFETASITWNPNGNSKKTPYEISVYMQSTDAVPEPPFYYAENISTPVPFANNYVTTSAVITTLSPNRIYLFRIRAMNGAGVTTAFSALTSTITVGNILNLHGRARTMSEINWSWDNSIGATYYEVYDVMAGTEPEKAIYLGSSTINSFTQVSLSTNTSYKVGVNAVSNTPAYGLLRGPAAYSKMVYTMAVTPLANGMNTFTNVSTSSFIINWVTNGNSTPTVYITNLSLNASFTTPSTQTVTGSTDTYTGLLPNYRYYAKVTAYNGDNIAAAPLLLGSKYTVAQSPSNVRPTSISMSGVTISWDTGANSPETIYEVRASSLGFGAVTPIMPFSRFYTASTYEHTGLLTATTYYYDVASRNGEGLPDNPSRIDSVPNSVTWPGPGGAPAGSIAGISDPSKDTTINGTLPNAREIWLTVPAGSFAQPTAIAISSSVTNSCSFLVGGIKPLEVAVFSENSAQPQVPVIISLSYDANEANAGVNGISSNRAKLVMARYNPVSGQCLPLETLINDSGRTITATTNHFSVFQVMLSTAASNLNNVRVFPNPFYTNRGNGYVTIDRMPASAKVRIYTLSGDKVWEGTAGTTGFTIWKGANKSGELVASGVYLAVIDASSGKKIVKIAVER